MWKCCAQVFDDMHARGVEADAIACCSSCPIIEMQQRAKQSSLAQVLDDMQARGAEADVVACCSTNHVTVKHNQTLLTCGGTRRAGI